MSYYQVKCPRCYSPMIQSYDYENPDYVVYACLDCGFVMKRRVVSP